MRIPPLISLAVVAAAVAIVARLWHDHQPTRGHRARARPLTSDDESLMFARLREAFPEAVVLVKVALAALISVPVQERNRLRHRLVDFVLCDASLRVWAVVQLEADEEMQAFRVGESAQVLLENAGYKVFAWTSPPTVATLHDALRPAQAAGPVAVAEGPYGPRPSMG